MTPVRLTVVLTHPIQYYAPWFRHLELRAPEIALTVVHATEPLPGRSIVARRATATRNASRRCA